MPSSKINFFDLDLQYNKYQKDINQSITKCLNKGQFILGSELKKFEKKIATLSSTKYAVGTSSGTDSLLISLLSVGVKRGDEIITSSFSWLSVVETILLLGAKPIYVDIKLNDFNLDYEDLKSKINKKTKAIITTSLFGYPCELEEISKLVKNKNITLIEDSAQSFGAKIKNMPLSSYADITSYSFFPSKIVGAYGDAGGLATNDLQIYKKIIAIRNHGQKKYGVSNKLIGLNGRLDEIQAAILNVKLTLYKKEIISRNKVAAEYKKILSSKNIYGYTIIEKNKTHVYGQFSILVKNRKIFQEFFKKNKIPTKIFYPQPLYNQYKQKLLLKLPNTEFCCKHIVSIPINIYSKKRFEKVYNCLKDLVKKNEKIFFKKKILVINHS